MKRDKWLKNHHKANLIGQLTISLHGGVKRLLIASMGVMALV